MFKAITQFIRKALFTGIALINAVVHFAIAYALYTHNSAPELFIVVFGIAGLVNVQLLPTISAYQFPGIAGGQLEVTNHA